jgi:hypothetical protein
LTNFFSMADQLLPLPLPLLLPLPTMVWFCGGS